LVSKQVFIGIKKILVSNNKRFNGTTSIIQCMLALCIIIIIIISVPYLVETDIVGVFTETLTTDVEVVLADQTGTMSTDTAIDKKKVTLLDNVEWDDGACVSFTIDEHPCHKTWGESSKR
jgi:hypothetical protein